MYTHFAFDYGYAESSRFAMLLMEHSEGFEDPLDGLKDLDNLLREVRAEELGVNKAGRVYVELLRKDCCKKYHPDKEMNLCPKCGTKFVTDAYEDLDTEAMWFSLCCDTADSQGYELYEAIEDSKWSVASPESADWVMVNNARNISDGQGFYIDAKGLYKDKYIKENIHG